MRSKLTTLYCCSCPDPVRYLLWSRIRHHMRDPFMEFCGTMIMIIFGDGSVAQVLLSGNPNLAKGNQNKGEYQSISWGWGIGVCLGVYVCGGAGGHLNPAITFVNCLYRGFPWWKLPIYAIAQVMGCYCGAAIIFGNYRSAIMAYEGGADILTVPGYSPTATAGVFNTYPQPFLTKTGQVFSEILASAVLVFVIFALKDDGNLGAGNLTPLMLFFLIFRNWCNTWLGNRICYQSCSRFRPSSVHVLRWLWSKRVESGRL